MNASLSISVVIYHPNWPLLEQTLQSLLLAVKHAQESGFIQQYFLTVVDNSAAEPLPALKLLLDKDWAGCQQFLAAPENVGYARGHNYAINSHCADFHLVLNPDVLLDSQTISASIRCLQEHRHLGMVTPLCLRADGKQEYLCKTYPTVLVLLLRGFAPQCLRYLFRERLSRYDLSHFANIWRDDVLLASGCFMFFRQQALMEIHGFCEQFFLYFEDFDLSLRLREHWRIAFDPAVKITHYGGYSAKKGWHHIQLFMRSAVIFFNRHGWRFF